MRKWVERTYSQVSVDTCIPGSTSQILAVPVGDVLASLGVSEPLCQPEIDDIHVVLLLSDSDEEVVRLDISMQEVPRMDKFYSL